MLPGGYSRTATMDARDAMALALARLLEGIDRQIGGERIKFARVYDEWPSPDDKYDCPAACILSAPEWTYDDSGDTPKIMEQTLEANADPSGENDDPPNYALYKTAEVLEQFSLVLRVNTVAQRSMLKLAVEEVFQTRNITMDPCGQRYGLLLDLPEYYGLQARASLLRGQNSDNDDSAMRNQREATFIVSMQTAKVQVGGVWPFAATITRNTQTATGDDISSGTTAFSDPIQIPAKLRSL